MGNLQGSIIGSIMATLSILLFLALPPIQSAAAILRQRNLDTPDVLYSTSCQYAGWMRLDEATLVRNIARSVFVLTATVEQYREDYEDERFMERGGDTIPPYEGHSDITSQGLATLTKAYYIDLLSLQTIWRSIHAGELQQGGERSTQYEHIANSLQHIICKLGHVVELTVDESTRLVERIEALEWYHGFMNVDREYRRRMRDGALMGYTEGFLSRFYTDIELVIIGM